MNTIEIRITDGLYTSPVPRFITVRVSKNNQTVAIFFAKKHLHFAETADCITFVIGESPVTTSEEEIVWLTETGDIYSLINYIFSDIENSFEIIRFIKE
jgi:hypothetical protein